MSHPAHREIVDAQRTVHDLPEMWIPSLMLLTLSWCATIGITAGIDGPGERVAYSTIPVFGPFILNGDASDEYIAPLIISGVVQTASLGLFITGLVFTKTERVSVRGALSDDPNPTRLGLLPGPVGTADSFGLTASLLDF